MTGSGAGGQHRRAFLKFLAGSPYVAALGGLRAFAEDADIETPKDALSVFDLEEPARRKVSQGHWAYMLSGVDEDATVRINHEAYRHVQLRPRRLRDMSNVDMRVELFGTTFSSPIYFCPTGGETSIHPDGEIAVARAAKAQRTLQVLSNSSSTGIEDVCAALGRPAWFQLYAPSKWEACMKIVRRVEAADCPVIALTVDNNTGRNSETFLRMRPKDLKQCQTCHTDGQIPSIKERRMYDGIDMADVSASNRALTWDYVDRLRKATKAKLFIKGIDTREDARLCVEHGVDGIMVSNHGGRSVETLRSTIEALPEVADAVGGRIPVFVDGGVRRGTDVFKALALGAKAVGIGRPFLWGLGAFGQAGVERVIEILQGELRLVMGSCGTATVQAIERSSVATPDWHV
jgi:isopentenyl diphosphate isomerase/L-lactate dehydrogenase-like FMN-dependent dehydrogenase